MVAITPRSYCNGLYFKHFRRWFFSRMSLRHVHLFECRRSTFEDVLQESLITSHVPSRRCWAFDHDHDEPRQGHPRKAGSPDRADGEGTHDSPAIWSSVSRPRPKTRPSSSGGIWPERFSELGICISTGRRSCSGREEFLLADARWRGIRPAPRAAQRQGVRDRLAGEKRGKPTAFRVCRESLGPRADAKLRPASTFQRQGSARRLTASGFLRAEEHGPISRWKTTSTISITPVAS